MNMFSEMREARRGSLQVEKVLEGVSKGAEVAAWAELAKKLYWKDADSTDAAQIESSLTRMNLDLKRAKTELDGGELQQRQEVIVETFLEHMQSGGFGNMLEQIRRKHGDDFVKDFEKLGKHEELEPEV